MLLALLFLVSIVFALIQPRFVFFSLISITIGLPQYLFSSSSPLYIPFIENNLIYIQGALSIGLFLRSLFSILKNIPPSFFIFFSWFFLQTIIGVMYRPNFKFFVSEFFPFSLYLSIFITPYYLRKKTDFLLLLKIIAYSTYISSLFAIGEFFLGTNIIERNYDESSQLFIQLVTGKGQFAVFISLSLSTCMLYFNYYKFPKKITPLIIFHSLLWLTNLIVFVITFNRSMFVTYVFFSLLLFLYTATQKTKEKKQYQKTFKKLVISVSIIAVVVPNFSVLILKANVNPIFSGKFTSSFSSKDDARLSEYRYAFRMLRSEKSLLGSGFGSKHKLYYNLYHKRGIAKLDKTVLGMHGLIPHLITKGGLVGLLLFIIVFIAHFFESNYFIKKIPIEFYLGTNFLISSHLILYSILLMSLTQNRIFSSKHIFIIGVLFAIPYSVYKNSKYLKIH